MIVKVKKAIVVKSNNSIDSNPHAVRLVNNQHTSKNYVKAHFFSETPHRLTYKYASFGDRIIAFVLDLTVISLFLGALYGLFKTFIPEFDSNKIPQIVIATIVWTIYSSLFESSVYQASIGKMLVGLKVVDNHYGKLTDQKAFLHVVLSFVAMLLLGFGIWGIAKNPKKQGWHDFVLNCYVIKL